jgi:hypothetical protein
MYDFTAAYRYMNNYKELAIQIRDDVIVSGVKGEQLAIIVAALEKVRADTIKECLGVLDQAARDEYAGAGGSEEWFILMATVNKIRALDKNRPADK